MHDLINQVSSIININLIWYILLFPFIFFWIWSILFIVRDISHRTNSLIYQLFAILLWTIPWIWFMLYFVFRPYRSLDDKEWRLSINTLSIQCLDCWELNHKDNKFCTNCWDWLTTDCKECTKKYYKWYDYCPYCGAPNLELE